MSTGELLGRNQESLPLIRPFPTKGLANHAEQAVQKLVEVPINDSESVLATYNKLTDTHFNHSVTGEYSKAGWRNKITLASIGHIAARNAMLNILDSYHYLGIVGRLEIPSDYEGSNMHDIAATQSKHAPYWLTYHSTKLLQNPSWKGSNYATLCRQGEENSDNFWETRTIWKDGSGKNRWPSFGLERGDLTLHQQLMDMFNVNAELALSLLCTRAIHHLIYTNPQANTDELYQVALKSVEEFSWAATTNRHLAWTPDWRERSKINPNYDRWFPGDSIEAILQEPPEMVVKPNRYGTSITGVRPMRKPTFCHQAEIQDGPIERGSLCAGNVFYTPKDDYERECARSFFSVLGMHPDNGNCYSLASIAFALAGVTLKNIVLPAYQNNRQREAENTKSIDVLSSADQ